MALSTILSYIIKETHIERQVVPLKTSSDLNGVDLVTFNFGSPITISEDTINVAQDTMLIGKWYPFIHKDKKYLAVKTSDKTVDIYRIKE